MTSKKIGNQSLCLASKRKILTMYGIRVRSSTQKKTLFLAKEKKSSSHIQKRNFNIETFLDSITLTQGLIGTGFLGATVFALANVQVAKTEEMLVKTGLGLSKMAISKITMRLPFQIVNIISLFPESYSFELKAMTIEKIEFQLPGVFAIGPQNDEESLRLYAQFLAGDKEKMTSIILGILEGETRFLAAGMTIEEIFNKRDQFKEKIVSSVGEELQKFGLKVIILIKFIDSKYELDLECKYKRTC